MTNKIDYAHMNAAEQYGNLSSARRLKVGAVIVKEDRIISIGYNGTPGGWDNNCEYKDYCLSKDFNGNYFPGTEEEYPLEDQYGRYRLKTRPEVIHAEMNAIGKLAKSSESGNEATMYITHAPCFDCAKLIHVAGIKRVFYRNTYRNTDGIEFLQKSNIEVKQL